MKYIHHFLLFLVCSLSIGQEQKVEPISTKQVDGLALIHTMNQKISDGMDELNIPGGVITIVYQDSVIYNRGFGFSNLASGQKVDPNETVFRVASLSKIVTTVAALQLVSREQLALDAPVHNYLDEIELASDFDTHPTLGQLLTHTAGFDQNNMARRTLKQDRVPSLKKYLSQHLPRVSHRPGEVISYSNHGMALAGYLVEKGSNQEFSSYVTEHIFQPLGMSNSSFENPQAYGERLAKGYRKNNQETAFEYLKTGPASMLMTTGKDMSAFMRMLLNDGNFNAKELLNKDLLSRMMHTEFRNHEFAEGRGLGFSVYDTNPKLVYHNGSFRGFNSSFYLYPDLNLGIFFSFNHKNGGALTREIMADVHEKLLHLEDQPVGTMEVVHASEDFSTYVGRYQHVKNSWDNLEKLENFPSSGLRVNMIKNQGISILNDPFRPIGNSGFINNEGGRVFFKGDANGHTEYLIIGENAYRRLKWYQQATFQGLSMVFILISSIVVIINALFRRKKGRALTPKMAKNFNKLSLAIALSILAFMVLLFIGFATLSTQYEFPLAIKGILLLPHLTLVLSLLLPIASYKFIKAPTIVRSKKIASVAFMLLMLYNIWYMNHWNILFYKI